VIRARSLAAVPVALVVLSLAACGGSTPGEAAAQDACLAYANTGRHQSATSVEAVDAIRATARADARKAAAADPEWDALHRDIEEFYSRQETLQTATEAEMADYFAADRRVQADCEAAGQDIGPLQP
jgi:hypothetical protein